jgi:plastocyanin
MEVIAMTARTRTAAVLVGAVAIMLAGCGRSNDTEDSSATSAPPVTSSPAASPAPNAAATITIDGFKFSDVTVPAGAQVTVVNNDSAEHSVTSDTAGAFDVEVDGGKQVTFTAPSQPGTYPFHCTYHPSMHGTLTVQ